MDDGLLMAALWFGIGALSYRLGTYIVGYTRSALLAQQTILSILYMLRFYNLAFEEDKEKFINLQEAKGSREDLEVLWDLTMQVWRISNLKMIKNSLPTRLRGAIRFNTWKEAMRFLEKHEKSVMNMEGTS